MSPPTWEIPRLPYNFIPGGSQHWEEKQTLNDRRKWKLAEINGHRYLRKMNGMMERLSVRKWRELLGRYVYGLQEAE